MKKVYILVLLSFILVQRIFAQTDYYFVDPFVAGDPTDLNAWNDQVDGSGSSPGSFTLGANWHLNDNFPAASLSASWDLDAGETIIVGDGIFPGTFILASGSALPGAPIVLVNPAGILVFQTAFTFVNASQFSPSTGSTVEFGINSPNVPAMGSNYDNLTISSNVTLGASIVVESVLDITSGSVFNLNGNAVTVGLAGNGIVVGSGLIDGGSSNNSGLTLNGSGCTLNFNTGSGQRLSRLTINLGSNSDVISLGTDLALNSGAAPTFALTKGVLDINGHQFVCSTPITFNANGSIKGSSASTFSVGGSSGQAITGSLLMNAADNTLKTLVMNRSTKTLTLGNALNVVDNVSVTAGTIASGGNLTLKSTSALKGRIGTSSGTITGNINVETFVPGTSTGWAQWGVAGVTGETIAQWDGQIPMACNGCINGTAAVQPGGFHSVQGWNEGADDYDLTITSGTALTPGKGFWVYVGSGQTTTTDFTLINTSPPVMGAGTIAITASVNKFNLIANPYASPISWTALRAVGTNTAKVQNAIYGWNADLNGGAGGAVDFVGGASNGMTDVIPAGQGFYVEAISAGNLDFNENIKSTANTGSNPLLRTSSTDIGQIAHLKLSGNGQSDQTIIRLHQDATVNFDSEWDAHKRFHSPGYVGYPGPYSFYTTLSTRLLNKDYSINSVAVPNGTLSIPLLARVTSSGTYSISAFDFEGYNSCLVLKDKLNNTYQDLKVAPYVCYINDTTSTPRFEIIVCESDNSTATLIKELSVSKSVFIFDDGNGVMVQTNFEQQTNATISAYNILGQPIMKDIQVQGTETKTHLNLDANNQIIFIKVSTDKETVTKKMVLR